MCYPQYNKTGLAKFWICLEANPTFVLPVRMRLPPLPASHRSLLRSQPGPHAFCWLHQSPNVQILRGRLWLQLSLAPSRRTASSARARQTLLHIIPDFCGAMPPRWRYAVMRHDATLFSPLKCDGSRGRSICFVADWLLAACKDAPSFCI